MNRLRQAGPLLASVLVFIILVTVCSLRYQNFFSFGVLLNLVQDNAFLGLVAIGMTFVILTGGIDLSVGAVLGFSSILVATLMQQHHWPAWAAITVVLAIGTAFGAAMGWFISQLDMPPFLVTLAGMFLARGAAYLVGLESISIDNKLFTSLSEFAYTLPILLIAAVLISGFILNFRPFGRNVYALGGSESSALLMGVAVRTVKLTVYAISGFLSALAGIANSIYTSSGNANNGMLMELNAIAAVVIGGTLLTGGVGGLSGTVVGVLMLGLIQTAINFEGSLSSWWIKVAIGVLLLTFILPQRLFGLAKAR